MSSLALDSEGGSPRDGFASQFSIFPTPYFLLAVKAFDFVLLKRALSYPGLVPCRKKVVTHFFLGYKCANYASFSQHGRLSNVLKCKSESRILTNSICAFRVSTSRRLKVLHFNGTCVICLFIGKEYLKHFCTWNQSRIEECPCIMEQNQTLLLLQKRDYARRK